MSGWGRPVLPCLIGGTALILALSGPLYARERPYRSASPLRLAGPELVRHQVNDPIDPVDDTTDQVNSQVDDTTDQVNGQVDDTTDQVDSQVDNTTDQVDSQVDNTTDQVHSQVDNTTDHVDSPVDASHQASAGISDTTGQDNGTSAEAANRNPKGKSALRGIAGAGKDVSAQPGGDSDTEEGGDEEASSPGVLAFTGAQGLMFWAALALLLIMLGTILVSRRRQGTALLSTLSAGKRDASKRGPKRSRV